ncbi:hypothetical protein NVS55_07685 [Myxococcus stipitatus]|uniref:hypothetical protein n=1 Tax=Myxococcus stipitatus TaxID=83455 RepID=UPI00314512F7
MTKLTMRTNPMTCSAHNSLWSQFDAASCFLVSAASKSLVGFYRLGGPLPVPC